MLTNTRRATHVVLVILAMAAAVLVRLPSAYLWDISDATRDAYVAEDGLPYLTDQDSYYHIRIVQNQIDHGSLGDTVNEDGVPWDTRSYWPEGRSAEYQPGIVWTTQALWGVARLFGASLRVVEFCFPAIMAALVACAAYVMGARMAGPVGGLATGVLVSCAPGFVSRTTFGRFDTDGLVILCDVLITLLFCEAMRARDTRRRVLACCAFSLASLGYGLCWAPRYAMLFVGIVLLGGVLLLAVRPFLPSDKTLGERLRQLARGPELHAFLLCVTIVVACVLVAFGPTFFSSVFGAVRATTTVTTSGVLPNLYASISEMRVPDFVSGDVLRWFVGYADGGRMTVIDGAGGAAVGVLAILALACLAYRSFVPHATSRGIALEQHDSATYLCVLCVLAAGALYASMRGVRFVEHLTVPAGILAGAALGWSARFAWSLPRTTRLAGVTLVAILCVATAIPVLSGSRRSSVGARPSISDVSAQAMDWIRENSEDPNAVIVSWWDKGYFYESESGHPCSWDGGSQNGARAILVGRALTAQDPELSTSILRMLACSGNRAINILMQHVDAQTAFESLFESLIMDGPDSREYLMACCNLTEDEAAQVEALEHPSADPEVYLIISDTMLTQMGWFEYYGNWDFEGTTSPPASTRYSKTWSGESINSSNPSAKAFLAERSQETMWRLAVDGETEGYFTSVFNEKDAVEHVRMWRVVKGSGLT